MTATKRQYNKARAEGAHAALEFIEDATSRPECVGILEQALSEGQVDPDENLIDAVGLNHARTLLGSRTREDFYRARKIYNESFLSTVRKALVEILNGES